MRKTMFLLTLLVGLGLVVAGFLLTAPIGPASSPAISDPRLPFAPVIFISGIMLLFASAVVYELLPSKR